MVSLLTDRTLRVGVVGGGTIGTALLSRLVAGIPDSCAGDVEIVVVEPGQDGHRGLPYSRGNRQALVNHPLGVMDVLEAGEFRAWALAEQRAGRLTRSLGAQEFVERTLFGRYLQSVHEDAMATARSRDIRVVEVPDFAIAVQPLTGHRARIQTAGGFAAVCDAVVLAVGHIPSSDAYGLTGLPRYVSSSPPFLDAIDSVPRDASVLVLGSRLSGIDTALNFCRTEHRGPILLASRSGRLPSVRGRNEPHDAKHLTEDAAILFQIATGRPAGLRWLVDTLERELCDAGSRLSEVGIGRGGGAADSLAVFADDIAGADQPVAWQQVLAGTNGVVARVWSALPASTRAWFLRTLHSAWTARRVPIPLPVATELRSEFESGRVHLAAGLTRVTSSGRAFVADFVDGSRRVDWVVNATGMSRELRTGGNPLFAQLLHDVARPDPAGGVAVDFPSCRVRTPAGGTYDQLYAVGNLTCGSFYMTSAIDVVRRQADEVARHIRTELGSLARTTHPSRR